MSVDQNPTKAKRSTDFYGAFAFVCVVLSCFSQFTVTRRLNAPMWQLILTFLLGGIYIAVAIFDHHSERENQARSTRRFLFQCLVATVMIYVSPVVGFFNIIVLPLVSQAFFEFKWPGAIASSLYLYAATIGVFWYRFSWRSIPEASINYFAAFAFTIAFTLITRQALHAKDHAEKLQRDLETANAQLRAHAAQTEDLATTRERNRLAREIHDGLGHYLTVVKTQLDAAAALLPANPERARDSVVKAAHLTAEALDDVRRSVGSLRTDTARPPLPEALRLLTQEAGLPVTVRLEGTTRPLPPGIEHALFRSAQEGLTNIRKHAAASAAEIVLDFISPGRVTLSVTDNGRGANGNSSTAGFGLIGIRERIEVLGGHVVSGNRPAGGFALTIEVPA